MPANRLVPAPVKNSTAKQRGAWRMPERPLASAVGRVMLGAQAEWNRTRGPTGLTPELSGHINREAIDWSA